jgi:hypothetical protein
MGVFHLLCSSARARASASACACACAFVWSSIIIRFDYCVHACMHHSRGLSLHQQLKFLPLFAPSQVPLHQLSSQDSQTFLFINNCQVKFLFINCQNRISLTYSHRQMRRRYLMRYLCMCAVGSMRNRMHA